MTGLAGQFEPIWIARATGWARSLRCGAACHPIKVRSTTHPQPRMSAPVIFDRPNRFFPPGHGRSAPTADLRSGSDRTEIGHSLVIQTPAQRNATLGGVNGAAAPHLYLGCADRPTPPPSLTSFARRRPHPSRGPPGEGEGTAPRNDDRRRA